MKDFDNFFFDNIISEMDFDPGTEIDILDLYLEILSVFDKKNDLSKKIHFDNIDHFMLSFMLYYLQLQKLHLPISIQEMKLIILKLNRLLKNDFLTFNFHLAKKKNFLC